MSSSLLLSDASDPPPIPAARSDSTGHPRRPLLIWVRTGTAHVRIDDSAEFHLTAGEGVWIPADGWNHRAMVTEPGTVAFPLLLQPGAVSLSEPTRFEVPDGWQDWLIQQFNLQVTPLSGRGYSPAVITDLLRRPGSRPAAPAGSGNSEPSAPLTRPTDADSPGSQSGGQGVDPRPCPRSHRAAVGDARALQSAHPAPRLPRRHRAHLRAVAAALPTDRGRRIPGGGL